MEIRTRHEGDVTLVAISGELDAFNLPALEQAVDRMVEEGSHQLVFNLGHVQFISSPALAYLVKTLRRAEREGGDLVLSQPSQFLRSTIRVLGLDEMFWVFGSDREALAHFGKDD